MAVEIATLGVKLENTQALAGAKETGAAFDVMGAKGMAAAKNITAALSPMEQAILRSSATTVAATRGMSTFSALNAEAAGHVGEHSLALGRLERSLGEVTVKAFGLNPQLALLGESLGKFALGSVEMVGILGALAALSYAWEKLTEDSRKAKEEHEKFIKSIGDLANAADAAKINTAARNLLYGTPFDEKGKLVENSKLVAGAFKGSLADMEATLAQFETKQKAAGNLLEKSFLAQKIDALLPTLDAARAKFRELQQAANNLASQPAGVPGQMLPMVSSAKSDAEILKDAKRLIDAGNALADAGAQHLIRTQSLVRDARNRFTDESLKHDEDARKLAEDQFYAQIDREEAAQRKAHDETVRLFESGFLDVFNSVRTKGIGAFRDLFSFIGDGIEKIVAKMAAQNLGQAMAGFIGTAAVGGQAATGAGGSITGGIGAAISAHPMIAAGAAVAGLAIGLLSLKASAEANREAHQKLEDQYKANIATVRTLLGQSSPLEKDLADLKNQFSDLRDQAKQLISGFDKSSIQAYNERLKELNSLEAQRAAQLTQQAAQEKQYAEQDLQARLLAAQGHQKEADDLDFLTKQQREYAAAVAAGKDALYLANLAEVQRAESISRSIEKLKADIAGFTQTIDSLKSFKDNLLLSDSANLSPIDKLTEAQRQYTEVLKAAQGGDQGAAGRLPQAAQNLLDAARTMFASGPQFQEILQQVLADTDSTIKFYDDQRTIAQQQLDALQKILDAIHLQTDVIDPKNLYHSKGGHPPVNGGDGDNSVTGSGGSGNVGVISAAGFNLLAAKLDEVKASVDANTRVTRAGVEVASL